jgi:hypothetical protein
MTSVGNPGVVVLGTALLVGLGVACGQGGGEVDLSDADEVTAAALRAVSPPGKVGHLKWEEGAGETPLAEAWIDADNGRFRVEHRSVEGEAGSWTVGVGEDWRTATYLAPADDPRPFPVYITAVDRKEWAERRIDNLAYLGTRYPSFLAWADERRVVGESTADGREVVVVEAKWTMDGDWPDGTVMTTTVELDRATLLPASLQWKTKEPDGTETEGESITQFEWEAVSPGDLPSDFFSPDALFALYSPVPEKLAEAGELGFDLYWLGEEYDDAAGGQLDLYLWNVDTESEAWPQLWYACETLDTGLGVVIIREAPFGQAQLGPLGEMQNPNAGPIEQKQVTVQAEPATLYSRTDRLSPTYEVTYRWLVVTLGDTAIELYPTPMSEDGQEINPLNNTEALVALAGDLAPVPAEP